MPLFEFTCRKCGHRFEEILSLSELEGEPPRCPVCGAAKARRDFSTFATGGAVGGVGGASTGGGCGGGASGFS